MTAHAVPSGTTTAGSKARHADRSAKVISPRMRIADLPAPEEEQRASGRYAAVPVKPTRVVPSEGHCFQHRVDAELGHEIPRMGADGIHGEV